VVASFKIPSLNSILAPAESVLYYAVYQTTRQIDQLVKVAPKEVIHTNCKFDFENPDQNSKTYYYNLPISWAKES
jgi:hypothetical protein